MSPFCSCGPRADGRLSIPTEPLSPWTQVALRIEWTTSSRRTNSRLLEHVAALARKHRHLPSSPRLWLSESRVSSHSTQLPPHDVNTCISPARNVVGNTKNKLVTGGGNQVAETQLIFLFKLRLLYFLLGLLSRFLKVTFFYIDVLVDLIGDITSLLFERKCHVSFTINLSISKRKEAQALFTICNCGTFFQTKVK